MMASRVTVVNDCDGVATGTQGKQSRQFQATGLESISGKNVLISQINSRQGRFHSAAFTLVELLAVVLVILILAGIALAVVSYVQGKVAVTTTKAQVAAIEAALESYKSDWGYYPPTTPWRISHTGVVELTNNVILYRALFGQGKKYLSFPSGQLRTSYSGTGYGGAQRDTLATNIFDVYNLPFNYYCSPATPFALTMIVLPVGTRLQTNYCTLGGQVNVASYDLFSYGRDHGTFASTNATAWPAVGQAALGAEMVDWSNTKSTVDDIRNFVP